MGCHAEFRGGVPQDHLEAVLEPQLVAHLLQPLLGQHRQLHGGHPEDEHVSAPAAVLPRAAEEVIHDAEGLRCAVVAQGCHGGQSHQRLRVLLDEEVAANHHAMQPGVPSTEHRGRWHEGRGALGSRGLCSRNGDQQGGKGRALGGGLELKNDLDLSQFLQGG